MASILENTYKQTQQWSEIVDASIEDGFTAVNQMIGQGISRTTSILAHLELKMPLTEKDRELSQKIVALLAQQAAKLPQDESVEGYVKKVADLEELAKTGEASPLHDRITDLRLEATRVFAHNEQEIEMLIEEKKKLLQLVPIFNFCCQVEAIKTKPTERELEKLKAAARPLQKAPYAAVTKALATLAELEKQPAPPPLSEKKVTWKSRLWSLLTHNCVAKLFSRCFSIGTSRPADSGI